MLGTIIILCTQERKESIKFECKHSLVSKGRCNTKR